MISEDEWYLASRTNKTDFVDRYKSTVLDWVKSKEPNILA